MISALYVAKNSIYRTFPEVDCWDEERDALKFRGDGPVIAHPPCRLWAGMRGLSTADPIERLLALHAVGCVARCGGILEHPIRSLLWKWLLTDGRPTIGGMIDVRLLDFGAPFVKLTRLWVVGLGVNDLPDLHLRLVAATAVVSCCRRRRLPEIRGKTAARQATPLAMAEWIVEVCRRIQFANSTPRLALVGTPRP